MTIPGPVIRISTTPPARGVPTDTGTAFMVGMSDRGDHTRPILITSMSDYATYLGPRVTYGLLYDSAEAFFREGGTRIWVGRVVGPTPVLATRTLNDGGAVGTLTVKASSVGTWGNTLSIQVVAGPTTGFVLVLLDNSNANAEIERSPELFSKADAIAWAVNDLYIDLIDTGSGANPAVAAAQALTTGTDDHANALDAQWQNALDVLTADLGPGQVLAPGQTAAARAGQLQQHAADRNRVSLLDLADSATPSTLTSAAVANRTSNSRYGAVFAPWVIVPGLTAGTFRTIPPSPVVAGIIARSDSVNSQNQPAAGENGQSLFAVGVSQSPWTDAQRGTLNDSNVNVVRAMLGGVRVYGWRTLVSVATQPDLIQLSNIRLLMALQAQARAILENHMFHEIDGRGIEFAILNSELKAMLLPYFEDGSLYGATPEEAFVVDTGPTVNTITTINNREIHAKISVRISPFGEVVILDIVKTPITQAVA